MNRLNEIITIIKSKINKEDFNNNTSINDINKLSEEVYQEVSTKYPELPYFLITDIIGRLSNADFNFWNIRNDCYNIE